MSLISALQKKLLKQTHNTQHQVALLRWLFY